MQIVRVHLFVIKRSPFTFLDFPHVPSEPRPDHVGLLTPRGAPQVYGALKRSAKQAKGGAKLSTIEAAVLGSGASLAAQAVTTPLDVVRTRVMTASSDDEGYEGACC